MRASFLPLRDSGFRPLVTGFFVNELGEMDGVFAVDPIGIGAILCLVSPEIGARRRARRRHRRAGNRNGETGQYNSQRSTTECGSDTHLSCGKKRTTSTPLMTAI